MQSATNSAQGFILTATKVVTKEDMVTPEAGEEKEDEEEEGETKKAKIDA